MKCRRRKRTSFKYLHEFTRVAIRKYQNLGDLKQYSLTVLQARKEKSRSSEPNSLSTLGENLFLTLQLPVLASNPQLTNTYLQSHGCLPPMSSHISLLCMSVSVSKPPLYKDSSYIGLKHYFNWTISIRILFPTRITF